MVKPSSPVSSSWTGESTYRQKSESVEAVLSKRLRTAALWNMGGMWSEATNGCWEKKRTRWVEEMDGCWLDRERWPPGLERASDDEAAPSHFMCCIGKVPALKSKIIDYTFELQFFLSLAEVLPSSF